MDVDDRKLAEAIAEDPFHAGLEEHGEFRGFVQPAMTDEEIETSRQKLARLLKNPQFLLVLTYFGLILLMGKTYA